MPSSRDVRASILTDGAVGSSPGGALMGHRHSPAEARLDGFRAGREAGREVGLEEGRTAAEAVVASTLGALYELLVEYQERVEIARGEIELLAVALAVDLAEVILGRQLEEIEPGSDVIARALGLRRGVEPVRVRMHPDDAEPIGPSAHPDVTIVPDPGLVRGSAIAEVGGGLADISIDAAMERVRAVL